MSDHQLHDSSAVLPALYWSGMTWPDGGWSNGTDSGNSAWCL